MPKGCRVVPEGCRVVPRGCVGQCLGDVGQCLRGTGLCPGDTMGMLQPPWDSAWMHGAAGRAWYPALQGGYPGTYLGAPWPGAKPGGAQARLARRVGFPAVLVMNLHEPSVSTRRQSMAESTGVNKCLYNEGKGERAPPHRPPLLGPGGKD